MKTNITFIAVILTITMGYSLWVVDTQDKIDTHRRTLNSVNDTLKQWTASKCHRVNELNVFALNAKTKIPETKEASSDLLNNILHSDDEYAYIGVHYNNGTKGLEAFRDGFRAESFHVNKESGFLSIKNDVYFYCNAKYPKYNLSIISFSKVVPIIEKISNHFISIDSSIKVSFEDKVVFNNINKDYFAKVSNHSFRDLKYKVQTENVFLNKDNIRSLFIIIMAIIGNVFVSGFFLISLNKEKLLALKQRVSDKTINELRKFLHDANSSLDTVSDKIRSSEKSMDSESFAITTASLLSASACITEASEEIALLQSDKKELFKKENEEGIDENIGLVLAECVKQRKSHLLADVRLEIDHDFYNHHYMKTNPFKFRSIITNLINNALEEVQENGNTSIEVKLYSEICIGYRRGVSVIRVINPVKSLTLENVNNIKDALSGKMKNWSTKKRIGQQRGIGINIIGEYARELQYDIRFDSKAGDTKAIFTLKVPKIIRPSWIMDRFIFNEDDTLIFLDDEVGHLNKMDDLFLQAISRGVDIIKSTSVNEVLELIKIYKSQNKKYVLFCDNNLGLNEKKLGLDIIINNKLHKRSILVTKDTARLDAYDARKKCLANGIKYLPKQRVLVGIPIFFGEDAKAIVIDDMNNDFFENNIHYFDYFKRFEFYMQFFTKDISIFLDINLNNDDYSFEDCVSILKTNGFTDIRPQSGEPEKYKSLCNKLGLTIISKRDVRQLLRGVR